jgi:hypothetical protein
MLHFYILYRITNKVNKKFYIGVHKTKDINDEYYGSGHNIKAAIEKYGRKNFIKEILHIFTNAKKAFKKEREIVNEELVKNKNCYNIKEGGHGGFEHIRKKGLHKASSGTKIIHNLLTNEQTKVKPEYLKEFLDKGWKLGFKPSSLKKMSESGKKKIQSPEHCKKNSETKKNTIKMYNHILNKHKYVKLYNKDEFLNNGWISFKDKKTLQ